MIEPIRQNNSPVIPNKKEIRLAEKSSQALSPFVKKAKVQTMQLVKGDKILASVELPPSAYRLLVDLLTQMGTGHAVSLVPLENELTTQAAANLLNVSRPFLVKLLEGGEIPFHKTGKHRRVYAKDIVAYKNKITLAREKTLKKLAEQAQKLNMGYDVDE